MKQSFKILTLMLAFLAMSVTFTACGDDDEPESKFDDWFIECTSVSGGGYTTQECSVLKNNFNADIVSISMKGIDRDQAIYIFDSYVKDLANDYRTGMYGVTGTLKVVLSLKNSSGKVIKTSTVNITSDGSSVS